LVTMKIPAKIRYAVRILCELNNETEKKPVPLSLVAKKQNLSAKYLKQLCQPLEKNSIIGSVRGSKGGYFLKKDLSQIRLLELMDIFEEKLSVTPCSVNMCPSKRDEICKIKAKWDELKDLINDFYKKTSVKDFSGEK